jgi:hypothetical protein
VGKNVADKDFGLLRTQPALLCERDIPFVYLLISLLSAYFKLREL